MKTLSLGGKLDATGIKRNESIGQSPTLQERKAAHQVQRNAEV
jgi:hypothetical protein